MRLSDVKNALKQINEIDFELPNGEMVPSHFHVTEIGKVSKHFIDCGGTLREEDSINFQLWSADDFNHRLHADKLLQIIALAEETLSLTDAPIEVEYQGDTIQKFGLLFKDGRFLLTNTETDCLAKDKCGIPTTKTHEPELQVANLSSGKCCTPGGGCC